MRAQAQLMFNMKYWQCLVFEFRHTLSSPLTESLRLVPVIWWRCSSFSLVRSSIIHLSILCTDSYNISIFSRLLLARPLRFIALTLFISTVMTQLSCVAGCNRTFTENKNLSLHKKNCLHVQRLHQASRDARKANGHLHDLLSHIPKPAHRMHRLQVLFAQSFLYLSYWIKISGCPRDHYQYSARSRS